MKEVPVVCVSAAGEAKSKKGTRTRCWA
jgi:hypothetical protein